MKYVKEICRGCIESEKGDVRLMDCGGCGFRYGLWENLSDGGYCPSGAVRISDEVEE